MAAISMEDGRERAEEARGRPLVHSQVLRIRKEETRIGEEIAEGLRSRQPDRDRDRATLLRLRYAGSICCSQSALRSSPLGNRSPIGSSS